jgi:hypothetical protein
MIDLQFFLFTVRALFITGITYGSFKVGMLSGALIIGSVLTFNQDILEKKESGLMFCYHCLHQIDPKVKANFWKALDKDQLLVGFNCASCRKDNYFPIAPGQKERAIHGGKIYGELKEKLFGPSSGSQHNTVLSRD